MIYTQPPGRPREFSPIAIVNVGPRALLAARWTYRTLREADCPPGLARYMIVDMLACPGEYVSTAAPLPTEGAF